MNTINTPFGTIRKVVDNNKVTYILPQNLSGSKLLSLKKKFKDFFADFKTVPLTKSEKAKNFFKVSYLPLTGIVTTVPQKDILTFAAVIIAFVFWAVIMAYFKYKSDLHNQREPISFNDINNSF